MQRRVLYSLALFLVLLVPALWNLAGSEVMEWDEGLAVRHARNALQHHTWLVPTQESGAFSRAYSKPPFLLWQVAASIKIFGVSPWSMRFGTALALVLSALIARQLAKRMGLHEATATTWALSIVLCGGALEWARFVNIEITLVLFNLLTLYCYARAFESGGRWVRWAVLSGLALCGAFLTKQFVCALAAIPLLLIELFLYDSSRRAFAITRMGMAGGIAVVVAGAWWTYAALQSGGRVADSMVDFTLVQRVKGLPGGQHINYLNRVADLVREGLAPVGLEVSVLGWAVLLYRRLRDNNPALWLLLLNLLVSVTVFGFISRSVLPWYSWSIIVPLLLGAAYLMGEGLRQIFDWGRRVADDAGAPLPRASLELAALVFSVSAAVLFLTTERVSQFAWILATLLVLFIGLWLVRRLAQRPLRLAILSLLVLWPTGSLAYGLALREAYHQDPGPLLALASPVAQANAQRVAVDRRIAGNKNRYRAAFGPLANSVSRAPWADKGKAAFDAYVEEGQLPSEYVPPPGLRLERSAGLVAWIGDLSKRPHNAKTLAGLLEAGPITYEAEWSPSGLSTSMQWHAGKRVRGAEGLDAARYRTKTVRLMSVKTTQLPKGKYTFGVHYDADCSKLRRTPSGKVEVNVGGREVKRLTLSCAQDGLGTKHSSFELSRPAGVEVVVRYQSGGLWVDYVTLERQKSKPPANKPVRAKKAKKKQE